MNRVYNFSAGPSVLPLEILEKAASELVCYKDTGMSVMEMSHRSGMYEDIINRAEASFRKVLNIPDHYKVLFLQGGASLQFSMVPMNLLTGSGVADYVCTGEFAKKALGEAQRYGKINVVGSSEDKTFSYLPKLNKENFTKDADYFHITSNNTIFGTQYKEWPEVGNVPLVADMSSDILSKEIDVTRFGIIYAGAQKNMGPAGLTMVIIREDLIGKEMELTPTLLKYSTYAKNDSMYNTPPTYGIYIAGMIFDWVLEMGGLKEMEKRNIQKANILYDYLDSSSFYKGTAVKEDRSIMNIPFVTPSAELDGKFVKEAAKEGFQNLKGHRLVGGMRASIYNAMPSEGLQELVKFMKKFEEDNQ